MIGDDKSREGGLRPLMNLAKKNNGVILMTARDLFKPSRSQHFGAGATDHYKK